MGQPDFIKEVGKLVASAPVDAWKAYLRWHYLNHYAGRLSTPFVVEDFHFSGTVLSSGVPENRPAAGSRVLEANRPAAGARAAWAELYVAKAFPPEAKAPGRRGLVKNVKAARRDDLSTLDWMSPETRREAVKNLDAIAVKIGATRRSGATTRPDAGAHERVRQERDAGRGLRPQVRPGQDRKAKGSDRVGHDPADGQRLLQPRSGTRSSSPPASCSCPLLRRAGRRRGQLWRHRRGHRPRADARLRRSGPQVRRGRQPASNWWTGEDAKALGSGRPGSPRSTTATWRWTTCTSTAS